MAPFMSNCFYYSDVYLFFLHLLLSSFVGLIKKLCGGREGKGRGGRGGREGEEKGRKWGDEG